MNKYTIIVKVGNKTITKSLLAKSLEDCKDRLVRWVYDTWDYDFKNEDYRLLKKELVDYKIYLGEITEDLD